MFDMNQPAVPMDDNMMALTSMSMGADPSGFMDGGMDSGTGDGKGKGRRTKERVFTPDPVVAAEFEQKPPKTRLNEFLPKKLGRSCYKADVTYSSVQTDTGYQAMLTLHCLAEQQFAGEICASEKEAEQSVAQQALDFYADEVAQFAGISKKRQMGMSKAARPTQDRQGMPLPDAALPLNQMEQPAPNTGRKDGINAKDQFILFLNWKMNRNVTRADFVFKSSEISPGQHQATVTLPCVEGQVFAGQISPTGKAAEFSAAEQAMAFYAEEVVMWQAQKAGKETNKSSKKKKSGSGSDAAQALQALAAMGGACPAPGGGALALPNIGGCGGPGESFGDIAAKLQQLLTNLLGRPASNMDFSYAAMELGPGQHQSALTLHCLQDQQFAGEVCGTPQAAAIAATKQALQFYSGKGSGEPKSKKQKKGKTIKAMTGEDPNAALHQEGGVWQAKEKLNQLCMSHVGGSLMKGQIVYAITDLKPGYQAIVKLNCMGGAEYAGEVCQQSKEAEKSAALYAYAALTGEGAPMA